MIENTSVKISKEIKDLIDKRRKKYGATVKGYIEWCVREIEKRIKRKS